VPDCIRRRIKKIIKSIMSIPHSPNSGTKEKTAEEKNGTQMKSKKIINST
jgi:hypothetical protein